MTATSSNDLAYARSLLAKASDGQRPCVPVFGTGLNIQAATLAGYAQRDDWQKLLTKISQRVLPESESADELPRTHLGLWEALLCRWARAKNCYPFAAENELQRFICEELRAQENECRGFELYRRVAMAGFSDILSLNFDRRIALSCPGAKFETGPTSGALGSHGEPLFRHSRLSQPNGASTRIWYPHGDIKKSSTLKFGVRKYGYYVAVLREYLHGLDGSWRYHASQLDRVPDSKTKATQLRELPSWLPAFMERPVMFIGCGL